MHDQGALGETATLSAMPATAERNPARRGRGRRPLADVRHDVLQAAAALLFEESVAGFTVDKVIRCSGVSSATIYKYWPSRGALALDGLVFAIGEGQPYVDTGDIRHDLIHAVESFITMANTPTGQIFSQLIGAAQTDTELAAQFGNHYFGPRRGQALALLSAAQQRGQIRAGVNLDNVVDIIWGACYMRLLLPNLAGTLTKAFATQVVELALTGAAD